MATKAQRKAEIELRLAELTIAISNIEKGGQEFDIKTASGAGTERSAKMAPYAELIKERNSLRTQLSTISGCRGAKIGAGW